MILLYYCIKDLVSILYYCLYFHAKTHRFGVFLSKFERVLFNIFHNRVIRDSNSGQSPLRGGEGSIRGAVPWGGEG